MNFNPVYKTIYHVQWDSEDAPFYFMDDTYWEDADDFYSALKNYASSSQKEILEEALSFGIRPEDDGYDSNNTNSIVEWVNFCAEHYLYVSKKDVISHIKNDTR